jgi:hypothetical protein
MVWSDPTHHHHHHRLELPLPPSPSPSPSPSTLTSALQNPVPISRSPHHKSIPKPKSQCRQATCHDPRLTSSHVEPSAQPRHLTPSHHHHLLLLLVLLSPSEPITHPHPRRLTGLARSPVSPPPNHAPRLAACGDGEGARRSLGAPWSVHRPVEFCTREPRERNFSLGRNIYQSFCRIGAWPREDKRTTSWRGWPGHFLPFPFSLLPSPFNIPSPF